MLPAVAVKVAEEDPADTVTDPGTFSSPLLLDSETVAPPAGAAWLKVTVQVEVFPELRVVGLHVTALKAAGVITTTLPAVPFRVREVPEGDAPRVFVTPMGTVPVAVAESVTLTTATAPFGIAVLFRPETRHV